MKALSRLWFPAAVFSLAVAGVLDPGESGVGRLEVAAPEGVALSDTVLYPTGGYKLRRKGEAPEGSLPDSLLKRYLGGDYGAPEDTLPQLSARDTIHAPDSLREIDPFRYKYYVALLDSLTHVQVRDSLRASVRTLRAAGDSLGALSDSADRFRLDSLYARDSADRARAAFQAWYASLDKAARKKYDYEQKVTRKLAEMDSLKTIKEENQARRDSIREATPRILSTFALPDSLLYKRIISWQTDPDFHRVEAAEPDTGYNYHFNDYPFRKTDVQATWLGVAGSPVQTYNFFKRTSESGVDFYTPQESWTFSHRTLPMYNSKTPHTEMAYWGTLLATDAKESDNIHLLTTQNILPELNFTLRYDRWGGGGILQREETRNKTFAVGTNYLGRKYQMHAGFVRNTVGRQENGGILDNFWIRDTTVDAREINVALASAQSKIKRSTVFLDQQLRIPLSFLQRHRGDSLATPADSLVRDGASAFLGHSSEYSVYARKYTDDAAGSADTLRFGRLENKVFLRLQPWGAEAAVAKLDAGVGHSMKNWFDSTTLHSTRHVEHTGFVYAGLEGQFKQYVDWQAKARLAFAGAEAGDYSLQAQARLSLYPFRRARTSPVSLTARFESTLTEPDHYQKLLYSSAFTWNNDFGKRSQTRLEARLDIPRWKLEALAGYALLGNYIYYGTDGKVAQHGPVFSVLSASLRKEFVVGNFLHFDNRALLQTSSAPEVLPLPDLALNERCFIQFVVQRDASKTHKIMEMQIGADIRYNSAWYSPAWNPVLGVFHNQTEQRYENGPVIDAFVNVQWKRACIYIKMENIGQGWPMDRADYFSAHHYIGTQRAIKLGIFWPFYTQPGRNSAVSAGGSLGGGSGDEEGIGGFGGGLGGLSGGFGGRTRQDEY